METKQFLAEQLAACYNQKNWFAPLQSALDGVTLEQAARKMPGGNSILQIVHHLYFWNERHLLRFKGITPEPMPSDNDSTFESGNVTEVDWHSLVQKSFAVQEEFEKEILNCSEEKLASPISNENPATWESILSNANLHNAYHIGQIVMLRKMQEVWDAPKNGVN